MAVGRGLQRHVRVPPAKFSAFTSVLPNSADNLVKWIMDPRAVSPRTAMPDLGVSEAEARHMAAYLYSQ